MQFSLSKWLPNSSLLLSNSAWLLGTEVMAKLSRLVTLVALAFYLTPVSYGIVMLAVALHDVLRLLMRSGTGAQLIQCTEDRLPVLAGNAHSVQWLICISLCLLQLGLAEAAAVFYQTEQLAVLLQLMAFNYLFYPIVSVRVYLLQRQNKLKSFSLVNGSCIVLENLAVAAFLVCGMDVYAIAAGKYVFTFVWLFAFLRLPVQQYPLQFDKSVVFKLISTSGQLVLVEGTRALRLHSDSFIAGKLLSPELFGLYSFAKSVGIGLSLSISNAFNTALFPYACKLNRQGLIQQKRIFIFGLATAVGLVFIAQAVLAPYYIPLFFSDNWLNSIDIVMVLCLSALPILWLDTICCLERTKGCYLSELRIRFYSLVMLIAVIGSVLPQTPLQFAFCMLASNLGYIILCALPATASKIFIQHPSSDVR